MNITSTENISQMKIWQISCVQWSLVWTPDVATQTTLRPCWPTQPEFQDYHLSSIIYVTDENHTWGPLSPWRESAASVCTLGLKHHFYFYWKSRLLTRRRGLSDIIFKQPLTSYLCLWYIHLKQKRKSNNLKINVSCYLAQGDACFPNRFYQRLQSTYFFIFIFF